MSSITASDMSPRPTKGSETPVDLNRADDHYTSVTTAHMVDEDLLHQTLSRERECREEVELMRKEIDQYRDLNAKLQKQREASKMMLQFREDTIDRLKQSIDTFKKGLAEPFTLSEQTLRDDIDRLKKEKAVV